ncbi:MAG: glycosyltransferase [Clostridia bacterium]|nr:glycosyltransferase [Clostridia bacterium]
MIKVGLFLDTYFPMVDGVINVVHNYATRLEGDEEFDVTVFVPKHGKKYIDNFPYKIVRCKSVNFGIIDYKLPTPGFDRKFKKALKKSDLDVVHIHSPFMVGEMGIKYAKKHGIPAVATMHSQFEQDFYRATHSKLITKSLLKKVMKVFNRCDEFYGVSPAVSEVFLRYGANHLPLVLPNGTDMSPAENREELIASVNARLNLPADMPVFIFVGRITALKNVFFLVDALAKLKDKRFKMLFVGDGKDLPALKKHVSQTGLGENVMFLGKISDREQIKALFCRAKLFLFPSLYDASSLVQNEAASQSIPTVFLEGAVTASAVTDGVNGFIAPASAEKYAEKIESVLADDELYSRVALGANRDLYRSWDDAVEELKAEYRRLINEKKKAKK